MHLFFERANEPLELVVRQLAQFELDRARRSTGVVTPPLAPIAARHRCPLVGPDHDKMSVTALRMVCGSMPWASL